MVAIAAPAVAATFPDQELNLNGYLATLGVEAVFDVSFGAELTVRTYLDYIESANPDLVIAQPCPAIVTYIETHQPELIPFLAPADSPMLHTIKLIREYYPRYARHRVMVISPGSALRESPPGEGGPLFHAGRADADCGTGAAGNRIGDPEDRGAGDHLRLSGEAAGNAPSEDESPDRGLSQLRYGMQRWYRHG